MLLYRLSVYSRSAIFFKEINGDLHECVRQEVQDGAPMYFAPTPWRIEFSNILANTAIIAEAWDAAGLYQVGDFLRRLKNCRPVKILASILGSGTDRPEGFRDDHISVRLGRQAYERAGLGPKDIDVIELHDATSMAELIQFEGLGFCPWGEGAAVARSGATSLGGKIPVNPSGGLVSKGHPLGATGIGQIAEIVRQLRGEAGKQQVEGARIGMTENGGGAVGVEEASMTIHILEKV